MSLFLRRLGSSLRSTVRLPGILGRSSTAVFSTKVPEGLEPLTDDFLEKPVIQDVDKEGLEQIISTAKVPVVILMHRIGKDEATVQMAESVTRVAGRIVLAKVKMDNPDIETPAFVVANNGKIVGRAQGIPCQDELLPYILAVRSVLPANSKDDRFLEAQFTGKPPKDFVQERPSDLAEEH